MQQSDTDMADAQEDIIEMEDETCHSPLQQQEAEQPGSHSSEPPQQLAWDPPRGTHIFEDIGLLGFFADIDQQAQPPREELEKLLPGRNGSVLIRASPLTIAKALEELHLYYVQFPELCKACTCCPAYDALWMNFLQAEVGGGVTKRRLPGLLDEWYDWGRCQPQLCQLAQQLCYGPKLSAEVFDRATIQGVPSSTTKTEGKKRSRESVILMKDNNKYWAGRIRFFLSHTPPGVDVSHESGVHCSCELVQPFTSRSEHVSNSKVPDLQDKLQG
ncbi:TPA: hypothetical protein ACH3X1_014490 [Trebouxia sp. C0004]